MSLLPQQILPPTMPLGRVDEDGLVIIDQNWWLFLLAMSQQLLKNGVQSDQFGLFRAASAFIDIGASKTVTITWAPNTGAQSFLISAGANAYGNEGSARALWLISGDANNDNWTATAINGPASTAGSGGGPSIAIGAIALGPSTATFVVTNSSVAQNSGLAVSMVGASFTQTGGNSAASISIA